VIPYEKLDRTSMVPKGDNSRVASFHVNVSLHPTGNPGYFANCFFCTYVFDAILKHFEQLLAHEIDDLCRWHFEHLNLFAGDDLEGLSGCKKSDPDPCAMYSHGLGGWSRWQSCRSREIVREEEEEDKEKESRKLGEKKEPSSRTCRAGSAADLHSPHATMKNSHKNPQSNAAAFPRDTFSAPSRTILINSSVTRLITFSEGVLRAVICFRATSSKAFSGVKSPVRIAEGMI
jgi:hypothetical protein